MNSKNKKSPKGQSSKKQINDKNIPNYETKPNTNVIKKTPEKNKSLKTSKKSKSNTDSTSKTKKSKATVSQEPSQMEDLPSNSSLPPENYIASRVMKLPKLLKKDDNPMQMIHIKMDNSRHTSFKLFTNNKYSDNTLAKKAVKTINKINKVPIDKASVAKAIKTTVKENVPQSKGLTTSTTSSPSTKREAAFELECLEAHNNYRSQHGALPLTLNKKLCKEAKEWAKTLALKGVMQHKPNIPHGENIFTSWSSNPNHVVTGKEPVDKWYEEINQYKFDKEAADHRSGHFTQVVWRSSKELGVGFAKSRNGQIFVVARYNPAGNYVGSFLQNVLPKGTPVTSSPVSDAVEDDETFIQNALKIHNEYRRKHGVPDLKLNQEMCEYAKEWAEYIAKEGKMMHRTNGKYGENIFMMWSSDPNATPTAKDVCKKWYDEITDYNFTMETKAKELKAGHFTQMIWKESSEFGIAIAKGQNGKTFVVANYNPKGNFIGQFINNVPRPIK